ncbi:NfeD family protein [Haloarculaceae archaeon H-GB2-1]|nr:NfeD family protein [Haloarculaceae archaeon H-GB1-1]MEA5387639.1 NfeD family protein [Haloarculaceae archaeon H-GB11]MEA5409126.1 NfeD family protein [Haloarculaceae archaeon H-GB2-1]
MADILAASNLALLLVLSGAFLVIAEAFAPGAHFIVLGVALLVAGLIGLFLPAGLGILTPVILAALVIVVGGASLYVYRQFDFYGGKGEGRTSDSSSLRGKVGRVTEHVTETDGQVKLEDGGFNPNYQARAMDGELEVGTKVIVIDPGGGNVLTVESFDVDDLDRKLAEARERDAEDETNAETDPA